MSTAKFQAIQPVLPVQDVTVAIDFYVNKLGFTLQFQDSKESPRYAGVKRDDVELHLQWHDPKEWETVERPSLRFVISDVHTLFKEYKERDVLYPQSVVRETPWGTREFALFDPNKNGLTFYQDNPQGK